MFHDACRYRKRKFEVSLHSPPSRLEGTRTSYTIQKIAWWSGMCANVSNVSRLFPVPSVTCFKMCSRRRCQLPVLKWNTKKMNEKGVKWKYFFKIISWVRCSNSGQDKIEWHDRFTEIKLQESKLSNVYFHYFRWNFHTIQTNWLLQIFMKMARKGAELAKIHFWCCFHVKIVSSADPPADNVGHNESEYSFDVPAKSPVIY